MIEVNFIGFSVKYLEFRCTEYVITNGGFGFKEIKDDTETIGYAIGKDD